MVCFCVVFFLKIFIIIIFKNGVGRAVMCVVHVVARLVGWLVGWRVCVCCCDVVVWFACGFGVFFCLRVLFVGWLIGLLMCLSVDVFGVRVLLALMLVGLCCVWFVRLVGWLIAWFVG